jgi:hypothetical protein
MWTPAPRRQFKSDEVRIVATRFNGRIGYLCEDNGNGEEDRPYTAAQIRFSASELRQSRRCNRRVRGRIDVERKERVRMGRRLTLTARAIRAPWYQDLQST